MQNRREFLKGTAWMTAAALAAGCSLDKPLFGSAASPMANFRVAPLKKVRVGIIGLGERGSAAVRRLCLIPGVELTAFCDLRPEQVEKQQKFLKEKGKPSVKLVFQGREDSWKGLADADLDLVYICAPAPLHCAMEVYSLGAGKHVLTEVPGAQTNDEAWEIVEACEKARRHCMMLENCCYGEMELLAWNLCHKGLLGTLTHAEGGYIHNLVWRQTEDHFRTRHQKELALAHPGAVTRRWGNTYPTHALGPICLYMDMNRGDRMERVVSVSSLAASHQEYCAATYAADAWQNQLKWRTGDMNTSIIKTAKGRTIMMQVDMDTPRPYSRINLIQGSKGCFYDYPPRLSLAKKPGQHAAWLAEKDFAKAREEHMHPLWKTAGEIGKKVGGHGGMDFVMDLRWVFCLQNGLPLDMDVYDLASWSSIVPATAESDQKNGAMIELPDFTRGAWRDARPQAIGNIDLKQMGFAV